MLYPVELGAVTVFSMPYGVRPEKPAMNTHQQKRSQRNAGPSVRVDFRVPTGRRPETVDIVHIGGHGAGVSCNCGLCCVRARGSAVENCGKNRGGSHDS